MKFKNLLLPALLFYLISCGQAGEQSSGTTSDATGLGNSEEIKFRQYMVEGKRLYVQYCSNCHQSDGSGLGKVYPPISKSDYIDNNFEESICIIKNGREGEIVVNGITYNQPMLPIPNITDLEIAEISTFIYNSWGRDKGLIPVQEVQKILKNCP